MTEDDTPEALEARCWALRERAERAESERDKARAAQAEMRAAIKALLGSWARDEESRCYDAHKDAKHALSIDCGQGWLSPEKSRLLVEALERILLLTEAWNQISFQTIAKKVAKEASEALAAVKQP